jgi:hypothetical protein
MLFQLLQAMTRLMAVPGWYPTQDVHQLSVSMVTSFSKALSYHGEHHWAESPGYPGVHRFAAGAAELRECMSILTNISKKHASSFRCSDNQSYRNSLLSLICCKVQTLLASLFKRPPSYAMKALIMRAQVFFVEFAAHLQTLAALVAAVTDLKSAAVSLWRRAA